MQTIRAFCDKHPKQEMLMVELSKEGKVETNGFQCPRCKRIYVLAEGLGYLGCAEEAPSKVKMIPNPGPQLRCPQHKSPFYLAAFELNGDESLREWRCAYPGCNEMRTTIGESAC
jgi:phage FluMu protein Com